MTTHTHPVDWEQIAARRLRLFWAGITLGLIIGLAIGITAATPPVWIDDLPPVVVVPNV